MVVLFILYFSKIAAVDEIVHLCCYLKLNSYTYIILSIVEQVCSITSNWKQ